MSLLLLHTKVARSATLQLIRPQLHHPTQCARPNRLYCILVICAAGCRLNGFVLGSGSQCIRVAALLRTVAAGVSLRVVARCGAHHPAMATMHVRGRKTEYTQQRYINRLIRLKFSTIHVTASRVVYCFCQ